MSITTEDVRRYFAVTRQAIQIARMVATITPTDLDDRVLSALERALATLEPVAGEPWVADLVGFLARFLGKNGEDPVKVIAALRSLALSVQE